MDEKNLNKELIIRNWLESSEDDFNTMINLYNSKDYHWSLFIGHLIIEKMLKALYVRNLHIHPPFTHDLLRLVNMIGLVISKEQEEIFDRITSFNINARYDDYKQAFKKICTKEFTEEWLNKIKDMKKWLTNQF